VNRAATPLAPQLDAGRIARLRDVLAGGYLAHQADCDLAGAILARWPWAGDLVTTANDSHRRTAAEAVSGGTPDCPVPPAAGVIFAAAGYPLRDPRHGGAHGFHLAARAANPDAVFVYSSCDPVADLYSRALLAEPDPGHVSVAESLACDPAGLLATAEAQAVLARGPVQLQVQLCAHWWPGDFAAWAIAEYARLLRGTGSTVALTVGIPGGGGHAAEFAADVNRAGGTLYAHTADDIAGWVKAAGMKLTREIGDVRGRGQRWAATRFGQQRPAARVVEAVVLVP
jgi:hypothetical protein